VHEYQHPTVQIADDMEEFLENNIEYKLLYPPQRNWFSEYFCGKSDVEYAIDNIATKIDKAGDAHLEDYFNFFDIDLGKLLKASIK
jgi:hypothetical protein